jgi:hypothetical protein
LAVRFPARDADFLAVCKYENEERQIAALRALDPKLRIESISLETAPRPGALGERPAVRELAAGWAVLCEHASGDFLVAAEVASTVGYYLRMCTLLERCRAPAVLVSSDTNPYALALVHAARRVGRKTCFVTHGHVAEGPPPLDFDLSLLDGPAVREVYERAGPVRGAVVLKGSEGIARPMQTARLTRGVRTLGVVMSILVDWRRAGALLDRLRAALSPERIVLRLHPNRTMLDPRWADHLRLDGVDISFGDGSLVADAERCDLIAAANTSAHLTILKLGVPSVYVPGLDDVGDDYYGFVRERVVATAAIDGAVDTRSIARFYDDPAWAVRFGRFDAGYLDRQEACDRAVVAGMRALLSERSS